MSEYYYKRMHDAMEERLEIVKKQLTEKQNEIHTLKKIVEENSRAAFFYKRMQKHITENETIGDAWMQFYAIYAMFLKDIDEMK